MGSPREAMTPKKAVIMFYSIIYIPSTQLLCIELSPAPQINMLKLYTPNVMVFEDGVSEKKLDVDEAIG